MVLELMTALLISFNMITCLYSAKQLVQHHRMGMVGTGQRFYEYLHEHFPEQTKRIIRKEVAYAVQILVMSLAMTVFVFTAQSMNTAWVVYLSSVSGCVLIIEVKRYTFSIQMLYVMALREKVE